MGVTYDEQANAAFFYFSMKTPAFRGLNTRDFKYSHSITPDARFGFDSEAGLVWVRFRLEDENANVHNFVSLIDAPVEDTEIPR